MFAEPASGQEDSNAASTITVSGFIYHDRNKNNTFDGKEKPADNVKISLAAYPAKKGKIISSISTNAQGEYQFSDVKAGTYQFLITYPSQLTVLTKSFKIDPAKGDLTLSFPIVDRVSALRFTHLRVVNPASIPGGWTKPGDSGRPPTVSKVVDRINNGNGAGDPVSPFAP